MENEFEVLKCKKNPTIFKKNLDSEKMVKKNKIKFKVWIKKLEKHSKNAVEN